MHRVVRLVATQGRQIHVSIGEVRYNFWMLIVVATYFASEVRLPTTQAHRFSPLPLHCHFTHWLGYAIHYLPPSEVYGSVESRYLPSPLPRAQHPYPLPLHRYDPTTQVCIDMAMGTTLGSHFIIRREGEDQEIHTCATLIKKSAAPLVPLQRCSRRRKLV